MDFISYNKLIWQKIVNNELGTVKNIICKIQWIAIIYHRLFVIIFNKSNFVTVIMTALEMCKYNIGFKPDNAYICTLYCNVQL